MGHLKQKFLEEKQLGLDHVKNKESSIKILQKYFKLTIFGKVFVASMTCPKQIE